MPTDTTVAARPVIVSASVYCPYVLSPRNRGTNMATIRLAAQVNGCVLKRASAPRATEADAEVDGHAMTRVVVRHPAAASSLPAVREGRCSGGASIMIVGCECIVRV